MIYNQSDWHNRCQYQPGVTDTSMNFTQYQMGKEINVIEHYYCLQVDMQLNIFVPLSGDYTFVNYLLSPHGSIFL